MENKYQYIDTKVGDKVLFILHGMAGNKETMYEHTKALQKDFRCIYLDLPGHNHIPLGELNSVTDYARFVLGFIESTDIKRFGILGYSFGGNVSLKVHSLFNDPNSVPLCIWASPSFGRVRISPKIMIKMSAVIPYKLWDKRLFMKMIHMLGANFTIEDVKGMKSTDKNLLKKGLKLLDEHVSYPSDANIFTVMDPKDPFVKPDLDRKYDVVIKGCGHSGVYNKVQIALGSINDYFDKNL